MLSTNLNYSGLAFSPINNELAKAAKIDGSSLIEKMDAKVKSLNNYSFKYRMKVFKNKKTVIEEGNFYYKSPNMFRLEETGPYKKGSVAVLGNSGKVKAHMGGGLKFIVVELSPHSDLLKSANGHPMIESDFKSLTNYLKSYIKQGMKTEATREPILVEGIKEKVFILDIHKSEKSSMLWKRIAVHPTTYTPVAWWDYDQSGHLHSKAIWHHLVANRKLPDDLFTIKHGKSAKKQMLDQTTAAKSGSETKKRKTSS